MDYLVGFFVEFVWNICKMQYGDNRRNGYQEGMQQGSLRLALHIYAEEIAPTVSASIIGTWLKISFMLLPPCQSHHSVLGQAD